MTCQTIRISDAMVIVCSRGRRARRCAWCPGGSSTHQCDWKLPNGRTCDKHLCDRHATHVGADKDLCPEHATAWGERLAP